MQPRLVHADLEYLPAAVALIIPLACVDRQFLSVFLLPFQPLQCTAGGNQGAK
jgi:hypothetical protein